MYTMMRIFSRIFECFAYMIKPKHLTNEYEYTEYIDIEAPRNNIIVR